MGHLKHIMLCFHFEHAQVPKTMTQNQTKATICSALGDLANSRPTKSTAFYELPPLLSYYKVPSALLCPIFSHQPELCIHATPHPSQIYPEITYREVSIVPIALSQCPSGKISVKLTAGQHLEYPSGALLHSPHLGPVHCLPVASGS